jgi:hypothetical protein
MQTLSLAAAGFVFYRYGQQVVPAMPFDLAQLAAQNRENPAYRAWLQTAVCLYNVAPYQFSEPAAAWRPVFRIKKSGLHGHQPGAAAFCQGLGRA